MGMCVCVCVWGGEGLCVCTCVSMCVCERERVSESERARERERERESERVRERESEHMGPIVFFHYFEFMLFLKRVKNVPIQWPLHLTYEEPLSPINAEISSLIYSRPI